MKRTILNDLWLRYFLTINNNQSDSEIEALKAAFFHGAGMLFLGVIFAMSDKDEATAQDMAVMATVSEELEEAMCKTREKLGI